ncbi:MAG: SPFH domain-containing protein [Candidatus Sericytochromatia bacterium]|nr:SPFH domain-containing protein [Candidatus Sericytochromatia bacterium]
MQRTFDKPGFKINGFGALLMIVIMFILGGGFVRANVPIFGGLLCLGAVFLGLPGLYAVQPNESRVLTFFGSYTGVIKDAGFWWSNPFAVKQKVSQRVRNFNSERLKVNDANGNPIEIAAVIVWKVTSPSSALFDVDSYEDFIHIQSETAIRTLCGHYPYDNGEDPGLSLRGDPEEVSDTLQKELEERVRTAGVQIIEARLTHLAYAPEIAQAMLRRQQAQAIIAARKQIVEGAVGMVQMALQQLSEQQIVELDDERKAMMVNNLMVALVSEHEAQPIINTGSLS